jgi:hypothetical protein
MALPSSNAQSPLDPVQDIRSRIINHYYRFNAIHCRDHNTTQAMQQQTFFKSSQTCFAALNPPPSFRPLPEQLWSFFSPLYHFLRVVHLYLSWSLLCDHPVRSLNPLTMLFHPVVFIFPSGQLPLYFSSIHNSHNICVCESVHFSLMLPYSDNTWITNSHVSMHKQMACIHKCPTSRCSKLFTQLFFATNYAGILLSLFTSFKN